MSLFYFFFGINYHMGFWYFVNVFQFSRHVVFSIVNLSLFVSDFIWVAEKMHICQLCILLAVIWLYRFCHEASTMMRDIPSLSFLCAGIYLVSSLHQSNYTWSSYKVRAYLQRQWKQILSGRVSLQDFVSAKEVCLGTYQLALFLF
ncbi:hypothetical protein PRUPE_4G277100 [Prunus persica]|uniref:Uncharacterized protein n=2 Tax=Prunus persica TaxID=3760 RepID=A0A251PV75_PRUPE|nr:uncharacterized protein LOC109948431 isoform X2 [Prunus persica]ONI14355.1 hypothetical protein PRUPE_4G277100 [Prunus persica]